LKNYKLSQVTDKTYTNIFSLAKETLADEIQRALAGTITTASLFHRSAVPISETISPLNWLSAQEDEQKIYWGERNKMFESATIGKCASFEIESLGQRHQLVEKIEKAVVSCSKLKKQSGSTLDKVQLINFADKVVTIIDENISDKDIVNLIADKIIGEIPRDSETIT